MTEMRSSIIKGVPRSIEYVDYPSFHREYICNICGAVVCKVDNCHDSYSGKLVAAIKVHYYSGECLQAGPNYEDNTEVLSTPQIRMIRV